MGMIAFKQLEVSPLPNIREQRVGLLSRVRRPLRPLIARPAESFLL